MKTIRLLSTALKIISVITFGASLFFGWMFYQLYLKWVFLFEDGRYFDPVEDVVYHDTNFVSGSNLAVLAPGFSCPLAACFKTNFKCHQAFFRSAATRFLTTLIWVCHKTFGTHHRGRPKNKR